MTVIDIVFVVSLSFLALSLLIFLIFFIPVLVQLSKLLESIRILVDIVKEYVESVHNKINNAKQGVAKFFDTIWGFVSPKK